MPVPERDADRRCMALAAVRLEYRLVRRRGRRGVGLRVDEAGLTVSAPLTMPLATIEGYVRDSERWVLRKIEEWRGRRVVPQAWEDGARLPFLGGGLTLRLRPEANRAFAARIGDELVVTPRAGAPDAVRDAVVAWYKRAAREHLAARVAALSQAAGIAPPRFLLSSAMGRWGSCNTRREVRLAWRLVKAPAELVDYVVCHELAHLRHMNHSRAFWAEVERQCAGHRALRERLFATDHLYRAF